MRWARGRGYLVHDPLVAIERPKIDDREAAILEKNDMEALLDAAAEGGSETSAVVHLAVFAGLRRGEIFALKWRDVDFGEGSAVKSTSSRALRWRGRLPQTLRIC